MFSVVKNETKVTGSNGVKLLRHLSDQSNTSVMSQSLDPTILRQTTTPRISNEYIIPEKYFGKLILNPFDFLY